MSDDVARITDGPAAWLSGTGEQSEIVVSSRVRLARNIAGRLYPLRADPEHQREVVEFVHAAIDGSGLDERGSFLDSETIDDGDRDILIERHLISPEFMRDERPRGLFIGDEETVSVMVNEEDHLRIQTVSSGLAVQEAMSHAYEVDGLLGQSLTYDFDRRFGHLTACPTNVGTGMRVSVLIHLPGLVLTREMDAVLREFAKIGMVVRGFYGEGSDVLGNLFQISNQTTLGRSEGDLVESLEKVARRLIDYETHARETLMSDAPEQLRDKIWRSYGILANARILTSEETMNLLSAVRLGVAMGELQPLSFALVNRLMQDTQPAHLQRLFNEGMDAETRDILRARWVREQLAHLPPLTSMEGDADGAASDEDEQDDGETTSE